MLEWEIEKSLTSGDITARVSVWHSTRWEIFLSPTPTYCNTLFLPLLKHFKYEISKSYCACLFSKRMHHYVVRKIDVRMSTFYVCFPTQTYGFTLIALWILWNVVNLCNFPTPTVGDKKPTVGDKKISHCWFIHKFAWKWEKTLTRPTIWETHSHEIC